MIATSVVRGSQQGQSHGGVYLVDPASQSVTQLIDWNTADIDWTGRGWDRGLRGIAFHDDKIYIAASDELFVYDRQLDRKKSFRNRYLKHCHEICVHRNMLYLSSTGFDSLLGFNLDEQNFVWALHASYINGEWQGRRYDPSQDRGPAPGNSLHINNVFCDYNALGFSGLRTGGLIQVGDEMRLKCTVELPRGIHNVMLLDDGVLFNDTDADFLRYVTRDGKEQRFPFPKYNPDELEFMQVADGKLARQGFGRGLCVIDERLVAAGSSPSTVTVFDLASASTVFSVNFSMDVRNAIHGLEIWPYPLPRAAAGS